MASELPESCNYRLNSRFRISLFTLLSPIFYLFCSQQFNYLVFALVQIYILLVVNKVLLYTETFTPIKLLRKYSSYMCVPVFHQWIDGTWNWWCRHRHRCCCECFFVEQFSDKTFSRFCERDKCLFHIHFRLQTIFGVYTACERYLRKEHIQASTDMYVLRVVHNENRKTRSLFSDRVFNGNTH